MTATDFRRLLKGIRGSGAAGTAYPIYWLNDDFLNL